MPHTKLLFHDEARQKVLAGAGALADAVRVTLGPQSRRVLLGRKWGAPLACDDGITIIKEIKLEDAEQNLGAQGRIDSATIARVGKVTGARYMVMGTFIDFYGDFRIDVRLVNTETSEIVKTESDRAQRDHLFDLIRNVSARLMKDANLPPLERRASDQRSDRKIPTEALTYYSRALLYQDRGQTDKAVDMYTQALTIFPEYAEAQEGLQRVKRS